MKYGARNNIRGKVKSVKKGDVMSLVKFDVIGPAEMASVLTSESVDALNLKIGDDVVIGAKSSDVILFKVLTQS